MNKINIHPLEGMTIEKISSELNGIATGKYTIYVDLNDGQVNIGKNSRNKKNELVIGKVDYLDNSKKKFTQEFFSNVRGVISKYHSSGILICKTTAIKQFSKKFVEKFEPVLYVDNPYYKRAEPMCLYDVNALKYNVKKYESLLPTQEEIARKQDAYAKKQEAIRKKEEERQKEQEAIRKKEEERRKAEEAAEKGEGKETPIEYQTNIDKGLVTPMMLGEVIYSYNKRAKYMRDKERTSFVNDRAYRSKKENFYSKKDTLLKFLTPTAIHTVKRTKRVKCFDWEWSDFDDIDWEDVDYFYDRNGDYHEYFYVESEFTEYYLYYEIGAYSFHHPITFEQLKDYKDLSIKELSDLNTFAKDIYDLLSVQFCDEVLNGLTSGDMKLVA